MVENGSTEVIYALGFNMPFFDRVIIGWVLKGGRDGKEELVVIALQVEESLGFSWP